MARLDYRAIEPIAIPSMVTPNARTAGTWLSVATYQISMASRKIT